MVLTRARLNARSPIPDVAARCNFFKLVPVRRDTRSRILQDRWRITLRSSSRITPRSGLSPRRYHLVDPLFADELANARETRHDFL